MLELYVIYCQINDLVSMWNAPCKKLISEKNMEMFHLSWIQHFKSLTNIPCLGLAQWNIWVILQGWHPIWLPVKVPAAPLPIHPLGRKAVEYSKGLALCIYFNSQDGTALSYAATLSFANGWSPSLYLSHSLFNSSFQIQQIFKIMLCFSFAF